MTGTIDRAHIVPLGLKANAFKLTSKYIGDLFHPGMIHRAAVDIDHFFEQGNSRLLLLLSNFNQSQLIRRKPCLKLSSSTDHQHEK